MKAKITPFLRPCLLFLLLFCCLNFSFSQEVEKEIEQLEHRLKTWVEGPPDHKAGPAAHLDSLTGSKVNYDQLYHIVQKPHETPKGCELGNYVVYGFHPYYMGNAWHSYNFKLLSHVSFFAYIIDCNTGDYRKSGAGIQAMDTWKTTPMVEKAHADGCRVDLTVTTNGSGQPSRVFLQNETAVDNCVSIVAEQLEARKADGVCLDFEDMHSTSDTALFLRFVKKLHKGIKAVNPDATISIAGVQENAQVYFNLKGLDPYVTYYVVMGYDYYWAGDPSAGPVAPLPGNGGLNLGQTIDDYLDHGVPKQKLVLALPFYGYEWQTTGLDFVPNNVVKKNGEVVRGKAITFRTMMEEIKPYYQRKWETKGNTSYFVRKKEGEYFQAWVPDSSAMALKFQLIKEKGIAGTGMWSLGMTNGYHTMWDLLHAEFGGCSHPVAKRTTQQSKAVLVPKLNAKATGKPDVPNWMVQLRWGLVAVTLIAFVILSIVVAASRKIQEELFNRYNIHIVLAIAGVAVTVVVLDVILQFFSGIVMGITMAVLFGVGMVLLGFLQGRKWERKRKEDHW